MTTEYVNAVDPDLAGVLDQAASGVFPPARQRTPAEIRASLEQLVAALNGPDFVPEPVGTVDDVLIELPDRAIPLRLYRPVGPAVAGTIVYFHGGGFVAGSLDTHDKTTRRLCNTTQARVVSVDYRLAPEFPYPAGLDDCYEAAVWSAQRFSPEPVVVMGDSAGGAMAAAVAVMARDRGTPRLDGQVLAYPALDPCTASTSMRRFADGYVLTRDDMRTYWEHYLGDLDLEEQSYADLLTIEDLRGLPPAIVVTAGFDPLRDEGASYAGRLAGANVPVVSYSESTLIHGFLDMVGTVPAAAAARERLLGYVAGLFQR